MIESCAHINKISSLVLSAVVVVFLFVSDSSMAINTPCPIYVTFTFCIYLSNICIILYVFKDLMILDS